MRKMILSILLVSLMGPAFAGDKYQLFQAGCSNKKLEKVQGTGIEETIEYVSNDRAKVSQRIKADIMGTSIDASIKHDFIIKSTAQGNFDYLIDVSTMSCTIVLAGQTMNCADLGLTAKDLVQVNRKDMSVTKDPASKTMTMTMGSTECASGFIKMVYKKI